MELLDLAENKFSDGGGAALLECLHNINELRVFRCHISYEMEAKMRARAFKNNVRVYFEFH